MRASASAMPESPGAYGIAVTRVFDAPRERVWREWTEPEAFADWFGGEATEVPLSTVSMDVRPGGRWRLTMKTGQADIHWAGEYRDVVPPERLVFTITDRPDHDARELITVELADLSDGRTEMRFEQTGHMTPEQYRAAEQGWGTFFARLDARLAAS
jgi:uncharacterized protein YndB with AHSA1/START domain